MTNHNGKAVVHTFNDAVLDYQVTVLALKGGLSKSSDGTEHIFSEFVRDNNGFLVRSSSTQLSEDYLYSTGVTAEKVAGWADFSKEVAILLNLST